jgi:hypothetical protein
LKGFETDGLSSMPDDPVNERRSAPRRRVLKAAFIVISDKAPKLECTVRNLSDTGAALQVSTSFGIPAHFEVIIDGIHHRCRTIWRTDTKIGIAFE